MKRKLFFSILALEAVICLALALTQTAADTSLFAFPFVCLGSILRQISLSGNAGNVTVYYNPVYQREDGSVYALTGSGISTNTDAVGQQFSQKQEDTQTHTDNGKTISLHNSVNLTLEVIEIPVMLRILQMDGAHSILHTAEISPANMPDTLSLLPQTHYVICEYITLTEEVSDRKIYSHSDKAIQSFVPQKDGLCLPKVMNLQWNE